MPPQTFIFIGRSGCGKGTQGKLIELYLKQSDPGKKIYYHESGARFREFITGRNYSNLLSREIYERDDRQPDFLAIWIWGNLFIENLTGDEHLIIDGAPRSLPEAQVLSTALDFYGRKAYVIHLNVSRSWSERHLLDRGRADDTNIKKIDKRLNWFDRDVLPAIEYFENHPDYKYVEVNGEQPIESVHAEIVKRIFIENLKN